MTQVAPPLLGGDFIQTTLTDLSTKGYRCIPAALNQEGAPQPLGGFREGQQYPSTDPLWQQATMIAICQADTLMLDLDGYKPNAADQTTIAAYLGITPQQLQAAMVQAAPERQSYHWLFRLTEGVSDRIVGNCGKWLPHVDLRLGTNNQLIYVKPGKHLTFPPVHTIQPLDLSRVLVPFPQRVEPVLTGLPVTLSESTTIKGAALLREMCDKLRTVTEGGRNAALNDTALIVAHYVGGGEISQTDAEAALTEAALAIGLNPGETASTIRSGMTRGVKEPKRCAMTPQEVFSSGLATPTPRPVPVPDTPISRDPVQRNGFQFLAGTDLAAHFRGCVYIASQHRVLTEAGKLMKPEVFNAAFGGYVFSIDASNDKTTRKAFEAFTESQAYHFPRADRLAFRPELTPGSIFTEAGTDYVNCYYPYHGERIPGDVEPMLNHMKLLIPNDRDREILMSWVASCIQNPGKKHQWSPVLVGTEGNGKSLIGKIVRYALGDRYTAEPRSNQLGGQFNGWIENKLFAIIEEVHMNGRREMMDSMKPLITNSVIEVEKKGVDSYDADNRCNILLCTNHKDAVIKTRNDRRYAIIYTGQQTMDDRRRDGMVGDYFSKLWDWFRLGGFAACADYFDKYPVTVNMLGDAPETSSTDEAIAQTMGGVEQEILEAVDEGRCGFAGGWISSFALDNLIEHIRAGRQIPPRKRGELLKTLGYEPHPALRNGRCNNPVAVDGGRKPKLYIKQGHIHANLQRPAEVERHYAAAQGDPVERGKVEMTEQRGVAE